MNNTISTNKTLATSVATFILFGVLGSASLTSAHQFDRSSLTADERKILREIRSLLRNGEVDEARDVINDSNLSDDAKESAARHLDRFENRQAIKEAVENDDYQLFVELTEDAPFAEMVDEELFEAIKEAHELRENGDIEGAREIMKEAGLKGNRGGHKTR